MQNNAIREAHEHQNSPCMSKPTDNNDSHEQKYLCRHFLRTLSFRRAMQSGRQRSPGQSRSGAEVISTSIGRYGEIQSRPISRCLASVARQATSQLPRASARLGRSPMKFKPALIGPNLLMSRHSKRVRRQVCIYRRIIITGGRR